VDVGVALFFCAESDTEEIKTVKALSDCLKINGSDLKRNDELDLRALLPVVERTVKRLVRVKFGVGAGGDDLALVEHEDFGRVANGGKAVGDDEHGFADDQFFEGELDGGFALAVEGAGGLVEDEDRGVAQESAREREALFLSAGETCAAFTDDGVVAIRETADKIMCKRGVGGRFNVGEGGLRASD